MDTIARIIELALLELLGNALPETFDAECEIELRRYRVGTEGWGGFWDGDFAVTIGNTLMLIGMNDLDGVWHTEPVSRG